MINQYWEAAVIWKRGSKTTEQQEWMRQQGMVTTDFKKVSDLVISTKLKSLPSEMDTYPATWNIHYTHIHNKALHQRYEQESLPSEMNTSPVRFPTWGGWYYKVAVIRMCDLRPCGHFPKFIFHIFWSLGNLSKVSPGVGGGVVKVIQDQGQGLMSRSSNVNVIQGQGHRRSRSSKFKVIQGQGHPRSWISKVKVIHKGIQPVVKNLGNYGLDPYNCTMINLSRHLTISYPAQSAGTTPSI
jgi:hypothetical protein